jgi:hypothetical protein
MPIDLLALSGHKGLFGPPGTGALYIGAGSGRAPLRDTLLGFGAITCALTVSGCMVRLVLRATYVDPGVVPGLAGAVVGAALATVLLREWARR